LRRVDFPFRIKISILGLMFYNDDEEEEKEEKKEDRAPAPDVSEKFLKIRTILLSGEVNKPLAERVIRQLLLLEAESLEPIKVMIDSPGGDADAGYAIIDMIRFIGAPVYTIGMGLVASAGANILLAAPKERRLGLPNSHYLIHQPSSGMRGVATEIEIHAQEIEKMRRRINELIATETGQDLAQVEKDTDRDFWMNADEAVKYGLLSRVVVKRADLGV
jgi:ATP-dependent Clp protease, protease subunit